MSALPPHIRKKGPKDLPKLPLSVFTPPNSSAGDSFPLPPSPSALHPAKVIDANIVTKDVNYTQYKKETGTALAGKLKGVVLSVQSSDLEAAIKEVTSSKESSVVSFIIPFDLEKPDASLEAKLASVEVPVSLSTVFTKNTAEAQEGLKWALKTGKPVDVDIQATLSDSLLEGFEELIGNATKDLENIPPIIVSNILPPPLNLDLPIMKLMNHPAYLAFQSQVAVLSLSAQVYVKFLPPDWDAPTPQTPFPGSPVEAVDTQQLNEWKRRIKMYLAPVIEAFGSERIIFGSSPSSSSKARSQAGDWYEIARESLAETGIEQAFVDAIFFTNAERVYAKKS